MRSFPIFYVEIKQHQLEELFVSQFVEVNLL
jgi:hypothetical protein